MSRGVATDIRAIAMIDCPRCGAPAGQQCRRKRTRSGPLCCNERRKTNQERLRALAELPGRRMVFDYPAQFVTLPAYTAHRGQVVTVGTQVSEDVADRGPGLEVIFHVTADDGWKGHAFLSELKPVPEQQEALIG